MTWRAYSARPYLMGDLMGLDDPVAAAPGAGAGGGDGGGGVDLLGNLLGGDMMGGMGGVSSLAGAYTCSRFSST